MSPTDDHEPTSSTPSAVARQENFPDIKAPAGFKAIIAVGISGSGRAHWAREFVKAQRAAGHKWLVLCRDDMRLEKLREHGVPESGIPLAIKEWSYAFSNPDEAQVHGRWIGRARWAVEQGFDGIVSADTNLDGGRSATSILRARLGIDKSNIIRKLFDASLGDAVSRDASDAFTVGKDEIAKQLHQLGRTLSLRNALDKAPLTAAWTRDTANGFQIPKSLLPKAPKLPKADKPKLAKTSAPSAGM